MVEPVASPSTWKAFFVVGLLFPLHIILGILSVPFILYHLCLGSTWACGFMLLYLPFYLYPAQTRFPGWKGFEALWDMMDYSSTCPSYFGGWGVHGGAKIDKNAQYVMACHPHGTVIFQRCFWRSTPLSQMFTRPWRMLAASILFRIPIVRLRMSGCGG